MKTERHKTRSGNLVQRISGTVAATAMTVALFAGLGSAEVVGVTALALAAGRRSGGFGLPAALGRSRRRHPATGVPQPR